jgi:hypothetical protein
MKHLCKNSAEVAKEAFWLAWNACGGTTGMGFLQDKSTATRSDIWEQVTGIKAGDYALPRGKSLEPYGDYVFGRMMKLKLAVEPDGVVIYNNDPRPDYQAWSRKYATTLDLVIAADKNING